MSKSAYWVRKEKKGGGQAKGNVIAVGGKVLARGVTHREALDLFPGYRITADSGMSDPMDHRLPGSYASRQ